MIQSAIDVCCLNHEMHSSLTSCCKADPKPIKACCEEEETHQQCDLKPLYLFTAKFIENIRTLYFSQIDYGALEHRIDFINQYGVFIKEHLNLKYRPPDRQEELCVWII